LRRYFSMISYAISI